VQSYLPLPSFLKSLFDSKRNAKTSGGGVDEGSHSSSRRASVSVGGDYSSSSSGVVSTSPARRAGSHVMGDHYTVATPTHDEIMRYYDPGCVEVRLSGIHGYGVFTTRDLPKGSFVIEYIGRKMERATIFQVLTKEQGRYVFNLDEKWSIDGSVPENRAGRINHSCEGNCHIKKVDGHIWVVAKRDIRRGEELSYNYGYRLSGLRDMEKNWRCNCGAPNCIGFILRKKDWPELKRKMAEREEMRRRRLQSLMDLSNKAKSEEPSADRACHVSLVN
jgi:hypothetical protein